MMPGQTIEKDEYIDMRGTVTNEDGDMSAEWHGTADVPLPDPHARMPGFPYKPRPPCVEGDDYTCPECGQHTKIYDTMEEFLCTLKEPSPVTLPAAEAALLTRIAEVAGELRNPEPETKMALVRLDRLYELTKLTNEWRIEWKHKPRT